MREEFYSQIYAGLPRKDSHRSEKGLKYEVEFLLLIMYQANIRLNVAFLVFVGQKLFSCHMCNTSFSTKGSLKVHMRLHTGSKPFKCPYCDLRFRTSGHRKTHIQFHFRASSERHKSKRFSSSTCQSSQGETGQAGTGQGQSPAAPDTLQPVGLLQTSSSDPNIYLPTNQVLTGQFDQNLLQPGLVGQTILPASMSGRFIINDQLHF